MSVYRNLRYPIFSHMTWMYNAMFGPKSQSPANQTLLVRFIKPLVKFPFIVLRNFRRGFCIWTVFVTGRLNFGWNSLLWNSWYNLIAKVQKSNSRDISYPCMRFEAVLFSRRKKNSIATSKKGQKYAICCKFCIAMSCPRLRKLQGRAAISSYLIPIVHSILFLDPVWIWSIKILSHARIGGSARNQWQLCFNKTMGCKGL